MAKTWDSVDSIQQIGAIGRRGHNEYRETEKLKGTSAQARKNI